jgi:hypothetical protein
MIFVSASDLYDFKQVVNMTTTLRWYIHSLPVTYFFVTVCLPNISFSRFGLFMNVNNLLNLIAASQENPRAIVNVLWDDIEHAIHVRINCQSTRYSEPISKHDSDSNRDSPFSNTKPIGPVSYKILNFPFGLFLSAG